ncbi:MAG TPA: hypothetical protein VF691_17965 [Cytophagaceae bacterium]|jgi:hypothetical protein
MISESSYLASRIVSASVERHFKHHIELARQRGEKDLAPLPEAQAIENIIDVSFWASLRREEGYSPKISLAFLPPEMAGQPIVFEHRHPLTPAILTKLSPGLERPGVYLGVWQENDALYVWGTTLKIPNLCLVVDVSEPGLLVVKHRRVVGFGKFANVAILQGDQVKIVDERSASLPDCPALLQSLLGSTSPSSWDDYENVLVQIAVSMRAHKRGGIMLVIPSETQSWRDSIIHPMKYVVSPAYDGIYYLMEQDIRDRSQVVWQTALRSEIERVAGLTAIDGATLITDKYELLAFGAKISRKKGNSRVEQILFNEPILGGVPKKINPSHNGGTRHLSAAQFLFDQRDALALVASQDGHYTIFSWSPQAEMVQAHKIDTLLL